MDLREYETTELQMCIELMYRPKAIKVTYDFFKYLENEYANKMELTVLPNTLDEGVSYKYMGYPLIIDSTIKHPYYEIIE